MKILIAEDNPLFRSLLAELLSPEFEVVISKDGVQARDILLQEHAPNMALLDWIMPEITGPQLCRELRAHAKTAGTYLILLTAKNDSADIIAGLRAGADDYITKPFVTEELRARVRIGRRVLEMEATINSQRDALEEAAGREMELKTSIRVRAEVRLPEQARHAKP